MPFAERGKRTDDHIEVLRKLWGEGPASHDGEFTSFPDAYSRPRPTQERIPIVIGGHTQIAARRAGRLGDGFFPGSGTKEELKELIAIVRQTAVEHGRDPDAIEITSGGEGALGSGALDEVEALRRARRVAASSSRRWPSTRPARREAFGKYGEDVISQSM